MKNIILTAFAVLQIGAINQVFAQKTTQLNKLKSTGVSWYANAKLLFYSTQKKTTTSETVLRKDIATGGYMELKTGLNETQIEKSKGETDVSLQNGQILCKSEKKEIDLSITPEFNILKFSSQGQFFPGVISTAQAILNESIATPAGLPARKPMTIGLNLPGASVASFVLENPGTVQQQKVNDLIRQNNNTAIPAMIGMSLTEVDSKFDFAANLETSSGLFLPLEEFGVPAEVNAGTAFSGNVTGQSKRKTYLLKFVQPMFILSNNESSSASIFLDAAVAASKKDLVMINSVTYGRMVFIRIVSEENAGTVKTALEGKLGIELTELNIKAGNSVEGSGSVAFNSVVKEFKAVAIGGNVSAAGRIITDPNQLKSYIDESTAQRLTTNTGAVPISFTMVRVSDYASLGIRTVGTFDAIKDCKSVEKFAVYIKNFKVSKVVDNPVTGNNEDLFGTISVNAYYKNSSGTEIEIKDELNRPSNVWEQGSAAPLQLKEGESHNLFVTGNSPIKDGVRRFVILPEQISTGYIIIRYRIKDKIMKDGEDLGNSNSSVKYEEKDFKFPLSEWGDLRDEAGCTYTLKEVGGDATICINFSKYRE